MRYDEIIINSYQKESQFDIAERLDVYKRFEEAEQFAEEMRKRAIENEIKREEWKYQLLVGEPRKNICKEFFKKVLTIILKHDNI